MESSEKLLDLQCIKLLELLSELEVKKQILESHMKDGFFYLAKARYAIGINRVSKLHYPSTMHSSITLNCNEGDATDNGKVFELCNWKLEGNSEESVHKDSNATTLRKRHTENILDTDLHHSSSEDDTSNQQRVEDLKPDIDVKDPIRWFSVFAPQSLRSAQSSFIQAIQDSCDLCNLQIQLEEAQKTYHELQKKQKN